MKKQCIYLILIFCFVSSKQITAKEQSNNILFDTISVNKKVLMFPRNQDTVPYIRIDFKEIYPKTFRNRKDLKHLQQIFQKEYLDDVCSKYTPPKKALNIFIDSCVAKYRREFSEDFQSNGAELIYMYNHSIASYNGIALANKSIVSFYTIMNTYSGGAHPSYFKTLVSIDLKSLKKITLQDIIQAGKKEELTALVKSKVFKLMYENGGDKSYFIDFDSFKLNDNFYITETGIQFTYNTYEIAAYAAGLFEVELPYNEIEYLLKDNFKERFMINKTKSDI